MSQVPKHRIDIGYLSCKQSRTDKVQVQVEFLIQLGGERLMSETVLANYRKTADKSKEAMAVFVDKVEFTKLLDAAASPKKKAAPKKVEKE